MTTTIHSSTHQTTFVQKFIINVPSNTDFNFETLFFSQQSATNRQSSPRGPGLSYQLRSDVLYKNNKKLFSICPAPLPLGQDHFRQFPTPGLEGLDLSPGLPSGGMVTGKIEPCVSSEGDCNLPFFSISVNLHV